jgi:hypothetical protein
MASNGTGSTGQSNARALNGYTPAAFEQVIRHVALPAQRRELPPPDERTPRLIFNNYWTCEAGVGWDQTTDDPRSAAREVTRGIGEVKPIVRCSSNITALHESAMARG